MFGSDRYFKNILNAKKYMLMAGAVAMQLAFEMWLPLTKCRGDYRLRKSILEELTRREYNRSNLERDMEKKWNQLKTYSKKIVEDYSKRSD